MADRRQKVLLVGWDSADWKIIHPLLDAGELPAGAGSLRTGRSQAEEGQIARPREVSP